MEKFRLSSVALVFGIILGLLLVSPVKADDNTYIENGQWIFEHSGGVHSTHPRNNGIDVESIISSSYTVTIPAKINLTADAVKADGSRDATGVYTIGVRGNINGNSKVTVVPDASFNMTGATTSEVITASVVQTITNWVCPELYDSEDTTSTEISLTDSFANTTGLITVNIARIDKYTGVENFNFSLTNASEILTGGLYDADDNLLKDWDTLINEEIIQTLTDDNGKLNVTANSAKAEQLSGKLVLSSTVKIIPNTAFSNCTALTGIVIPNSVEEVGFGAFRGCTALKSADLSDSVELLWGQAFSGCTSLETVDLSHSIDTIKSRTFYNCTALQNITIPGNVKRIYDEAFRGSGLETVTVEEGVTAILGGFSKATHLTSIDLPSTLTTLSRGDSYVGAFEGCTSLTSIEIPDGVTTLGYNTFANCTALEEVIFPDTLTLKMIGDGCFTGCSSMKSFTIPDSVTIIGGNCFSKSGLKSLTIPASVEIFDAVNGKKATKTTSNGNNSSKSMFCRCESLETVIFQNDIDIIQDYTFYKCTSLKNISLPDSVTTIGTGAFYECSSLKNISLPDSVTTMGANVFYSCWNLESVRFSENELFTTIPGGAFFDCSSLNVVTLPKNITTVQAGAFSSCGLDMLLILSDSVITASSTSFKDCNCMRTLPANGYWVNYGYGTFVPYNLVDNYKADSIFSANANCFYAIPGLYNSENNLTKDFTSMVSEGMINIVEEQNSDKIYIGILSADSSQISQFNGVLVIPKFCYHTNNQYIADNAFDGFTGLTDVIVSDTIKYIGDNAFKDIPHVTYGGTATGSPWGALSIN